MARKEQEPKEAADYYRLKTEAVEELVTADSQNSPKVSPAELKKYRKSSTVRIPNTVKVLFVKFWFAGAVCYFVIWGLGLYIGSDLDLLIVAAAVMGFVTDLLSNNLLRFMEETPGSNEKWIMVGKRRYVSLVLNLIYAGVLLTCVVMLCGLLKIVGIEPLLFGIFYMGFDVLFLGMKNLLKKIVSEAKRKVDEGGV